MLLQCRTSFVITKMYKINQWYQYNFRWVHKKAPPLVRIKHQSIIISMGFKYECGQDFYLLLPIKLSLFLNHKRDSEEQQLDIKLQKEQQRKEAMNQCTKNTKLSKYVKSDNLCYCKVGRAITLLGAIKKSAILLSQY